LYLHRSGKEPVLLRKTIDGKTLSLFTVLMETEYGLLGIGQIGSWGVEGCLIYKKTD
jgi:hypothetical protein